MGYELMPKKNRSERCHGVVESVRDGVACGWVHVSEISCKSIAIEILSDDAVIARGLTDQSKTVFDKKKIQADSQYFKLSISYEFLDGQRHVVDLRVVGDDQVMPNSRKDLILPDRMPRYFDWLSRHQTMELAKGMLDTHGIKHTKARQIFLMLFEKACLAQETGSLKDARSGYLKIISAVGQNALCDLKMAETWLLEHEYDKALAHCVAALKAESDRTHVKLCLASVMSLTGELDEARFLCAEIIDDPICGERARHRLVQLRQQYKMVREKRMNEASFVALEKTIFSGT